MRGIAGLLSIATLACGPMYGPSGGQQAQGNPQQQQVAGPPGADPYQPQQNTGNPSDPYGDPQPGDSRFEPQPPPQQPQQPQQPPQPQPPQIGPQPAGPDPWGADNRQPPRRPDPPPPRSPDPPPPPPPRTGGLAPDLQAILDSHNAYRAQHCAKALTWSPKLEQVAQAWANSLKDQGCKFGHSGSQFGENLAAGTAGTLDGKAVSAMWYDEVKDYSFDSGGFSMQTGHFTQVVWRGTSQIGCGRATCRGMDIWVCNYDPPGNVNGGYRQNVQPKGCK